MDARKTREKLFETSSESEIPKKTNILNKKFRFILFWVRDIWIIEQELMRDGWILFSQKFYSWKIWGCWVHLPKKNLNYFFEYHWLVNNNGKQQQNLMRSLWKDLKIELKLIFTSDIFQSGTDIVLSDWKNYQ